ncbi:MAG: DNA topoisomerase I [Candidatus Thermoplasmatota archaeon]|nr:DNA topoisomerase I [Candidatus Thermoplasmatota archaeon]
MKLIICEKAIAARRIATILSDDRFKIQRINNIPIYFFENNESMVIGLRGHIISLDYPQKYALWNRTKPRELIRVTACKKANEKEIVSALKKLANDVDEVIVATDFDREGELIGVEALDIIKEIKPDIKIKRARFSALTNEEVTDAFENLSDVDYNLSKSAETRQIIDLAWGATLTRFISLASGQLGKDFLSVGRVQSPTLRLIVDREKEINAFKPKTYWEIEGIFEKDKKNFKAKHVRDRFWENEPAKKIFENVKSAKKAIVLDVTKKQKKEKPPAPFNTTAFLQAATSLGFSASDAMRVAEDLYQNGLISYPRTDNTVYPKTLNLRNVLKELSGMFPEANEILSLKVLKPTKGKKLATDHPPIHPVSTPKSRLNPEQHEIYELVVRRFFATLSPDALSETMNVEFDVNNEKFISSGYRIIEQGWRKYYPYIKTKETLLPSLEKNEGVNIIKIEMPEKETKPPKRYSQGSLIPFMEKLGLGTKSTRHEIIKKLYNRGYIQSKQPVPTKTGFAVSEALENYAEPITKHDMINTLEEDMSRIAEGKKSFDDVVKESQDMLEKVMDVLEKNGEKIGSLIRTALKEENIVGMCPQCSDKMIIIRSKRGKRFAGCMSYPKCTNSYPLPQNGKIIPLNEKCEHCGAPTVKLITQRGPMTFCINMECPGRKKSKS